MLYHKIVIGLVVLKLDCYIRVIYSVLSVITVKASVVFALSIYSMKKTTAPFLHALLLCSGLILSLLHIHGDQK